MILPEEELIALRDYMRDERKELEDKKERLEMQLQAHEAMEQLLTHIDGQEAQISNLNDEVADLNAQIEKLQAQLTQAKAERDALKQDNNELKMRLDEQAKMNTQVLKAADHADLIDLWRKYLNKSKRKVAIKRSYIKMVVTELALSAKVELPEDILNTLETFDDDLQNQEQSQDQELMTQLKDIFWGDMKEAGKFLTYVRGKRNVEITAKVNDLIADNKISKASAHRPLWEILHAAGIYTAGESNWNQQVD